MVAEELVTAALARPPPPALRASALDAVLPMASTATPPVTSMLAPESWAFTVSPVAEEANIPPRETAEIVVGIRQAACAWVRDFAFAAKLPPTVSRLPVIPVTVSRFLVADFADALLTVAPARLRFTPAAVPVSATALPWVSSLTTSERIFTLPPTFSSPP